MTSLEERLPEPPLVVLVGAPNVGKSTLFNRLIGARRTIVTDQPGATRDRIYGSVRLGTRCFTLCDTGGILPGDPDAMAGLVKKQTLEAVSRADLLIFVVDGRTGLTPLDEELASMLRREGKPVLVAVNKLDRPGDGYLAAEHHRLGCGPVIPVSAEHGLGFDELLSELESSLGDRLPEYVPGHEETGVAVVGRPNVGKSSLLNRLLREERLTVSEVPGTTRDAVDTLVVRAGRHYRFIDTAGLRQRGRSSDRTETLSSLVARRTIGASDVVLMVLDASVPLTALDQTVAGYAAEGHKPVVLVANKWDLVTDPQEATRRLRDEVGRRFRFMRYAPLVTVSALTGLRTERLFQFIDQVDEAAGLRLPTGELNRFLRKEIDTGRGPNLMYITQTGIRPPTFVVFTHDATRVHFSLRRRIENRLREEFGFGPTPLLLRFRSRTGGRKARA